MALTRKIHPAGPSEAAMRPGGPDDPRSYPHFEWGGPGLPRTPWEAESLGRLKARDRELRREGDTADTSAMKTMLGKWKDENLDDLA